MSDGDRSFLAPAIFGLILTSGAAGGWIVSQWPYEPSSYPSYQEGRTEQVEAAARPSVNSGLYAGQKKQPCGDSRSRDESDLCAQWRSAKAAERAADYGLWQVILSLFGVIGLAVTLAFNWIAIRLALDGQKDSERALRVAESSADWSARAADAANQSNLIAQETMQRELRPYVYLERPDIKIVVFTDAGVVQDVSPVSFFLKNYGRSPAKEVKFIGHAEIGGWWNQRSQTGLEHKICVELADIPPGNSVEQSGYAVSGLSSAYRDIISGTRSIFLEGQIQYRDGFGNPYKTNFQLALTGERMGLEPPTVTPHWNSAT